jgi:hypothetical protein
MILINYIPVCLDWIFCHWHLISWLDMDSLPQIPNFNGLYPVDDMFPCWLVDMMTSSHIVLVVFSSRLIYLTYVTEIQTWYYTLICFHLFLVLKPFHNIIGILLPKLFWPTVRKNVLVIEKNFWNLRLKVENLQTFWDH